MWKEDVNNLVGSDLMKTAIGRITDFYLIVFPLAASLDLINLIFGVAPVKTWIVPAAIAAAVLVLIKVLTYASVRRELRQVRTAVKESLSFLVNDVTEVLFSETDNRAKEQFRQLLIRTSAYLVPLAGAKETTQAQVFLVRDHGSHSHFYPSYTSNGENSKARYSNEKTPKGIYKDPVAGEVWEAALKGEARYYPNLRWYSKWFGEKPMHWKRYSRHRYACFITVPLLSATEQLAGLLTINSTRAHALTPADVDVMKLIALTIQIADRDAEYLDRLSGFDDVCSRTEKEMCTP